MGGYGAMNVALWHPQRFSIVESWLGFFNGLSDELRAARPVIARDGLHAFVYGGASDSIADPSEDAPFAAALRAAGASAHGAVYPGEHDMQTLHAHLAQMLRYVGGALSENARAETAAPHVGPAADSGAAAHAR
jgi:S-formylglutathione hydrolase FrmB